MKYQSTAKWRDLTDNHLYLPGDAFPFDGRGIPEDRIDSLVTGKNRAGFAVIRPCQEEVKETPTEPGKAVKKPVRSRKKANP